MIRATCLTAAALLAAACTPTEGSSGQAPAGQPAGWTCDAAKAQFAVGQSYSDSLAEQAREAAGAKMVRKLIPGQVVTMEFNGGRLNLDTDAAGKVSSARCG
ncbi:I78 family peptidase inhibitor [Sphingoaurantiacus capsulatus]|uniref:I78 family peptidase inhibitor n=1 Tax=Sphingoaurantiacus capsulatus TaxID=1771310 RepID=A0ABV7X8E4_9SPHN